ncbi:protein PFC0760c-like isoform X1 [Cataglyphis hispanica]|uniref:protein PFC0760c-like isoform X1 n=1 Tax=Cataglyphis hispanica TaxID=1086592 RepID=UPI00217FCC1C|nr:protein PFC0760c-like isoform X1 [Cataglyphis hispanica]
MQQQQFYNSCIKINGIPLLSPLMTDSIKEEMRHYRALAIKIEEKLKDRKLIKHNIKDKCVQANVMETIDQLKSIKYDSDSDLSNHDTTSDTNNSDSYSRMTIVESLPGETRDKYNQSTASDVEHSQIQVCLTDNVIDTKPAIAKTDQNEYINATEAPTVNEDVSESKPKVPNTLNIVPITLSNEEDNIGAVMSKEKESPPKLSRQGSYVLDTPSPMLLAHMNTELIDKNYVPTSTNNVSRRKQWNITQPKVKWENKQLVAENAKQVSNKLECATDESTFQHPEFDTLAESYQIDQSVSNSKTEVTEEHICKLNITSTKCSDVSDTSLAKQSSLEIFENDSDICVSKLSNKKTVENTNSYKSEFSCEDENRDRDKIEDTKEHHNLIVKTKSSITPEKLLTVYKEIEEMHKKQMMELIYRQQKEQFLLQAEFQKQQMLLLAEIEKCSSNISYQVNASSNVTSNQLLINNKEKLGNIEISETRQELNVNSASKIHEDAHYNNKSSPMKHKNVIVCPLDYISSKNLYLFKHYKPPFFTDTSPITSDYDFTREIISYNTKCNNNNNDDDDDDDDDENDDNDSNCKTHNRTVHKNSNVNRQLFPLNSNTTHVPILDTSVYLDKHVQAVNIINAYTRGYLVRRLMRTERVITLKKIYKEALQCMLKLHVDAPLNLAEVDFLHRLQLQCDAASMNIVDLFAQSPKKKMKVIAQDREIKQSRTERPTSARSYSFATQKTLARRNLKEFESTMTKYQRPVIKKSIVRSRCQTWTSDIRDKLMSPNTLQQGIRRSTSAGTVRKPWR